jgi:hypothetical protein
MIRSRARLFIGLGKIVFCLCGAGDSVIFDSERFALRHHELSWMGACFGAAATDGRP